jgi:NAD-dependent deacetylase
MKVVVLTGSGVSAESGLATFRDSGGLWEGYDVMEVASIHGWKDNPGKVLDFYNLRRKQALKANPNAAHLALARLDHYFDVTIITQNVDNLHERAGSKKVIHLHGEITKSRSTIDPDLIYDIGDNDIHLGDLCEKGSQLRPHIVWFGEMVPMMELAIEEALAAEIFIVIGTSLVVYPAAGLLEYVSASDQLYIIDPKKPDVYSNYKFHFIKNTAENGTPILVDQLIESFNNK